MSKWQAGSRVYKLGDVEPEDRDGSAVLDNNATNLWLVTEWHAGNEQARGAMQILKCPSFIYRILVGGIDGVKVAGHAAVIVEGRVLDRGITPPLPYCVSMIAASFHDGLVEVDQIEPSRERERPKGRRLERQWARGGKPLTSVEGPLEWAVMRGPRSAPPSPATTLVYTTVAHGTTAQLC